NPLLAPVAVVYPAADREPVGHVLIALAIETAIMPIANISISFFIRNPCYPFLGNLRTKFEYRVDGDLNATPYKSSRERKVPVLANSRRRGKTIAILLKSSILLTRLWLQGFCQLSAGPEGEPHPAAFSGVKHLIVQDLAFGGSCRAWSQ